MFNIFKLRPTHFPAGAKNFLVGPPPLWLRSCITLCYGKIVISLCFIDHVTRPAVASIPTLKSRNHGVPAVPACFKVVELLVVDQLKESWFCVFGGANVDCCGQLGGGEISF